jgi:hypothetical protein
MIVDGRMPPPEEAQAQLRHEQERKRLSSIGCDTVVLKLVVQSNSHVAVH